MIEPASQDPEVIPINGLDGASGGYLLPPLTEEQIGRIAGGLAIDESLQALLREWSEGVVERDPKRAPSADVQDPGNLAETGWGVIFSKSTPAEVRRALEPLLELRRGQAGSLFHELEVPAGVDRQSFFSGLGVKPDTAAVPNQLPYYLLLVGDPREIPYRFQCELDVQYAVGRLHFDGPDATASYAAYAQAVDDAERLGRRRQRKLTFFAVENPGDAATHRTSSQLVEPLANALRASRSSWNPSIIHPDATRERLRRVLGGPETPAILFTAGHGVGFHFNAPDNEQQIARQGALVCQDWKGPTELVDQHHYFTAEDLAPDADLHGMIAICFACYSAGTPERDEFEFYAFQRKQIAPYPFVARLPQRLLARGALAAIGHVDRTWTSSFTWNGVGGHVQIYNDLLKLLMDGFPVGWAMEQMGTHHGSLAAALNGLREDLAFFRPYDYETFSDLWRATNDARNFVVLGDPAVRLGVD